MSAIWEAVYGNIASWNCYIEIEIIIFFHLRAEISPLWISKSALFCSIP